MQATDRPLSKRYAEALAQAALEAGELEAVRKAFQSAYRGLRERERAFLHPMLGAEKKKAEIDDILGGDAPATLGAFLKLLVDKKRFGLLPQVASDFELIAERENNVLRAAVRTAMPLGPEAVRAISERLGKATGKTVEVETREDPSLIGGMVVRVGDWVMDASFRRHLARMRDNIVRGA